jgi:hypothetical protein
LTFAFVNAEEAKYWVDDYYETFRRECVPIGRSVNPNVAMLTGFMCHENSETATARGDDGAQFFAYGLAHYWRDGIHFPGRHNLWREFKERALSIRETAEKDRKKAGMGGIGSPEQLIENFRTLEEAGVDQLILLHQSGNYQHDYICKSLRLFGARVLPQFKERDETREREKRDSLAPHVAAALKRIPPLEPMQDVPAVEAYPLHWQRKAADLSGLAPDRRPGMSAFWQLQVGGGGRKK